ncbi:T9SS type A sorting domain-containing protein [Halocola ammonii]
MLFRSSLTSIALLVVLLTAFDSQSQVDWDETLDVADNSFGNNRPRVVVDSEGTPIVMWSDNGAVQVAKWDGSAFGEPQQVNPENTTVATATWMGPGIAAFEDRIYVVYTETSSAEGGNEIKICSSTDGGETFSNPQTVTENADLTRFSEITVDENGNPVVAYISFPESMDHHEWLVRTSSDFGSTFSEPALASGWSSETTEACDCCPASLIRSDNTLITLFRDNNSDIRNIWAGFSSNSGETFTAGYDVDQQNWEISACPASGPHGVIVGDTLYSSFMSGVEGPPRVFASKMSVSNPGSPVVSRITEEFDDLSQQNFPRMAASGNIVATVWTQRINWANQLAFSIDEDITDGEAAAFQTIDESGVISGDVKIVGQEVFVVWQNSITGMVKFKSGTIDFSIGVEESEDLEEVRVYPNPSSGVWNITNIEKNANYQLLDTSGRIIQSDAESVSGGQLKLDLRDYPTGMYFLKVTTDDGTKSFKLLRK